MRNYAMFMIDPQGKEVLPSEFMAAAARNDLMKNIDRWVVGASLSFAAQKKPECLFVRLSKETVRDHAFGEWLDNHLRFAIEGFGSGRDSMGLLESVPLDFIKIDGTIIQGLSADPQLQMKVRSLVEAARRHDIRTIGERVEDANTMAVLWQLGVQYIQGYFVNEPEEVVLRAER